MKYHWRSFYILPLYLFFFLTSSGCYASMAAGVLRLGPDHDQMNLEYGSITGYYYRGHEMEMQLSGGGSLPAWVG